MLEKTSMGGSTIKFIVLFLAVTMVFIKVTGIPYDRTGRVFVLLGSVVVSAIAGFSLKLAFGGSEDWLIAAYRNWFAKNGTYSLHFNPKRRKKKNEVYI